MLLSVPLHAEKPLMCWLVQPVASINQRLSCFYCDTDKTRAQKPSKKETRPSHKIHIIIIIYFLNSCKRMNSMTQPCRPAALPASSWRSGGLWGGRTTLEPTPTARRIFCLSDFSPSRSLSLLTFCRRQRGKYD